MATLQDGQSGPACNIWCKPAKHQTLDPVIPAGLTCLPCCKCRPPKNLQTFYTGFGVLLVAFGGHSISFEVMDSMNTPK